MSVEIYSKKEIRKFIKEDVGKKFTHQNILNNMLNKKITLLQEEIKCLSKED